MQQAFANHVSEYGLMIGTQEEYLFRMDLFAKKDAELNQINASQDSYEVGHNEFSTYTDYEFERFLGAFEDD
jgi:hypothetical protein